MVCDALGAEAERSGVNVARLHRKTRPIDGASIKARRSSRLKPAAAQPEFLQRLPQQNRVRLARAPRRILLLAAVNEPVEKRSRSNDDRLRAHGTPIAKYYAAYAASSTCEPSAPVRAQIDTQVQEQLIVELYSK